MKLKYSFRFEDESDIAKGVGRDLDISFKHAVVICDAIRGMRLDKAVELLDGVGKLEKVIPFKKFNTGVGHKSGDVKVGKYPQKASKAIQKVLKEVEANADYKGLDTDNLKITHASAQKGRSRIGIRPKGRWKRWRLQCVHVFIAAKEMEEED